MKINPHPHDGFYNTDEQLVWKLGTVADPNARIPMGERAHVLRESLDYALDLLETDEPYRALRAKLIVERVLGLQDINSGSSTYGNWPKYLEVPLTGGESGTEFRADVIGFRLCKILALYRDSFSVDVAADIELAIGRAAMAIRTHNKADTDEKFALISVIVSLTGAEIVGDESLFQFGRERLRGMLEQVQRAGEFGDYNSPSLTLLALEECDFLRSIVSDQRALFYATLLGHVAWRSITDHFHPATRQWSGPHGWTDSDLLSSHQTKTILDPLSSCPDELRGRLLDLSSDEVVLHYNYVHRTNKSGSGHATTWLTEDACLGSIDEDILWQHRRPLIAYWPTASGKVATLRVRFLHDGHDFASGLVFNKQDAGRILSSFSIKRRAGDLHAFFDRPRNGIFHGTDFRVRYQLMADDAEISESSLGIFELSSGSRVAVIHSLPGFFDSSFVRWTFGREKGLVYVDAVCYAGKETTIKPRSTTPILIAAGLELLKKGEPCSEPPILTPITSQEYLLEWPGLELAFTARPRR